MFLLFSPYFAQTKNSAERRETQVKLSLFFGLRHNGRSRETREMFADFHVNEDLSEIFVEIMSTHVARTEPAAMILFN